ncbi:MAG: TonB-dependent receptor [Phascolarctobacterium sp.]|nr:TonB-dependent receptor [Phascolarctobacterium sp.]
MKKMTKAMLMTALILGSVSMGTVVHASELNTFTMDEYVVTASRYAKADLDIAADTDVITSERIEAIGATNVQQVLQTVPGLVYQSKGPGGASLGSMTSKISMRGVEKGTLVLLNGTPINYRGLYNLENIPVETIERIEVVKGGGSVLYGSEATGGVINIITKDKLPNVIKAGLGNNGRQNYDLTFQADKLGVAYTYDKWGDIGKTSDSTTALNPTSKNFSNHFNGSEKNDLSLNYKIDDNMNLLYRHGESNSYYAYMFNDAQWNSKGVDGKERYNRKHDKVEDFAQFNFKDDNGLKGNVYYNKNVLKANGTDYYDKSGNESFSVKNSKENNLTYGYDVQKLWQEKGNNYLLGTSYQREEYQEKDGGVWDEKKSRNVYSVYGSWETGVGTNDLFTLSARETWTTGANEDKNFDNFSGQVQYLHKFDDIQSAYATIGQSFVMPTFAQMYSGGPASITVGDPNLEPQKGINYEVGYKYETDTHKYKIAVFTTKIDDEISFKKKEVDGQDKYFALNEDFKNTGIEISSTINTSNGFTYSYGVTYSDPKSKSNIDTTGYVKGWRRTFGRLQMNGSITYQYEKWLANLTANYLAERVIGTNSAAPVNTKPYLLTTFNLRYAADKNHEFALSIDNVLDRQDNVNHSSSYYYSTPFTYLLSYTYKF